MYLFGSSDDFVIYDDEQNMFHIEALNHAYATSKGREGKGRTKQHEPSMRVVSSEPRKSTVLTMSLSKLVRTWMRKSRVCACDWGVLQTSMSITFLKRNSLTGEHIDLHYVFIFLQHFRNIYICTDMAWYILHVPSDTYAPFFSAHFS